MNSILHVGAGKCGSSSLQAALSREPQFQSKDRKTSYEYITLYPKISAEIIRKNMITEHTRRSAQGYMTSSSASEFSNRYIQSIAPGIFQLLSESATPVLSYEGWLYEHSIFQDKNLLPRIASKPKVLVFVRPQISWLNSGWWQWGAWRGQSLQEWLAEVQHSLRWTEFVRKWQQVSGVESVEVHSATRDTIKTFYNSLGASVPTTGRSNISLDSEVLRFFQRNRDFRASQHLSAPDFILERCLQGGQRPAPWVIPHEATAELIAYYRESNEELLSLVSDEERKIIESDPRWWDPEAYRDKEVEPAEAPAPTTEELESLARRAIQAVIKLDCERRAQLPLTEAQRGQILAPPQRRLPPTLRKAVSINGMRSLLGMQRISSRTTRR